MHISRFKLIAVLTAILLCFAPPILGDPCGMVPPIYVGNVSPISRIGLQKTYVFYKDGVETFVIRPGFRGNVDEFGMLIPFPSPPALRKVPDDIFDQIAKAIDPPEVVVDLRPTLLSAAPQRGVAARNEALEFRARRDSVRVLKQEAVGMYEVAVLEAGSAAALKRWMDQHNYQYPDGMDKVTEDYITSGWCFVAVKTKVGNKAGVDPKPGQRNLQPNIPQGSSFDGYVQGMGFRFKSDELVVPMRLSAFNGGDLRNVVYLLTDGPRKIRSIPEEYVMRQLTGKQLVNNLTRPLPLRILGGTDADIPQWRRQNLKKERDPTPHNGLAKELFASDLQAISTDNLSLEHEEMEKELLRIGEYLGLRGGELDADNSLALAVSRQKTVDACLNMLEGMTMTVVDGDFPREVVARENLTFAEYSMPAGRNSSQMYEAPRFGPAVKKRGILQSGQIDNRDPSRQSAESSYPLRTAMSVFFGLVLIGFFAGCCGRRSAAIMVLVAFCLAAGTTLADDSQTPDQMIEKLADASTATDAIAAITDYAKQNDANRKSIIARLLGVVKDDSRLPRRGWAIAALAAVGGQDVDEALLNVHADENNEKIIRTWAAAARVSMTRTTNGLIEKANLIPQFPALGRPIGMRLIEQMNADGGQADPEKVIEVTIKVPQLQTALAPAIMAFGPDKISQVALTAADDNVRRLATGFLGTIANQGRSTEVAELVASNLQFDPQASEVPWKNGALFVPGIPWGKQEAKLLVGHLIRWHLWCDIHANAQGQQQIHNNIRSLGLAQAAGYQSPGWENVDTARWLAAWSQAVGKREIENILKEQEVQDKPKYANILKDL